MNDRTKKRFVITQATFWAAAMAIPPIVMAILDGFDKHTPTRVAIFSSMCLMVLSGAAIGQIQAFAIRIDSQSEEQHIPDGDVADDE